MVGSLIWIWKTCRPRGCAVLSNLPALPPKPKKWDKIGSKIFYLLLWFTLNIIGVSSQICRPGTFPPLPSQCSPRPHQSKGRPPPLLQSLQAQMEEEEEVEVEEVEEEHHPVMSEELEPAVSTSEEEGVGAEVWALRREVEEVNLWKALPRRQSRRPSRLLSKMLHLKTYFSLEIQRWKLLGPNHLYTCPTYICRSACWVRRSAS